MMNVAAEKVAGAHDGSQFLLTHNGSKLVLAHPQWAQELTAGWFASAAASAASPPAAAEESALRIGRGRTAVFSFPGERTVVVRRNRRGGAIARLLGDKYLRIPRVFSGGMSAADALASGLRPFSELRVLEHLRRAGVPVPAPAAAYVELHFMHYTGAVATEELAGVENLLSAVYARVPQESAAAWAYGAGISARRMLDAGVFHVDLHLGNILCGGPGEVFLIDFDKALLFTPEGRERYLEKTLSRWHRSLERHRAAVEVYGGALSQAFQDGIRCGQSR